MRMTLNDIVKAMRSVLSAVATAASGIAGEILFGVLNFMFGILTALLSIAATIGIFIWLLTL